MDEMRNFAWIIEGLKESNNPSDWKQSLMTLAFITTESYGKGVKENLFIPYLKKAISHSDQNIKKLGIRFIISFKLFDLLSEADENLIAESFFEKYSKYKDQKFLKPIEKYFKKLKKENQLKDFLGQMVQGKLNKNITEIICFQLYYRDVRKIEESLDFIYFLIKELGLDKIDFVSELRNFIGDLDKRIYLKNNNRAKESLKEKALKIINY